MDAAACRDAIPDRSGPCAPASRRQAAGNGTPSTGRIFGILAYLTVAAALAGCRGRSADPVLTELTETRRISGDLRVEFTRAVDASNRAVMADTDEASRMFAREAEQATQRVEDGIQVAGSHLRSLGSPDETGFLDAFTKQFAAYRALDKTILELAVENTNLKAQGLLFGPAKKAAEDFRTALDEAIDHGTTPKNRCSAQALGATAIARVREIQILEAPHIAEADDAVMTAMEKEMTALQTSVDTEVDALAKMTSPEAHDSIADARAAVERFKEISRQIITLSRRNSNVRSLALSLRDAPPLTAACDRSLRALDEALAKEGSTATR